MVGENNLSTIINVGSTVDVHINGNSANDVYAGGIAGMNIAELPPGCILNSYAAGTISASGNAAVYVGGIAGQNYSDTIINCYYSGGSKDIAGIANNEYGTIEHCYSSLGESGELKHGDPLGTPAALLSKLNDAAVLKKIKDEHGVTPLRWKMGEGGMPELVFEQFTGLTIGGTYWFDLSALNIPGDKNTGNSLGAVSVPDTTLTWVPFTYAGTINAYSLSKAGVSTDDNVTLRDHSLFIADYAVTHTVSWETLDNAGFIFGNTYSNGGVRYKLRAPSMGSDHTPLIPAANEWSMILGKGVPIKNFQGMHSWGQDTYADDTAKRTSCGNSFNNLWIPFEYDSSNFTLGYRPVLEVPGTLASDALQSVALNLNGGSVGGEDSINIVYTGASFTAPGGTGLTRPADLSAGTYFAWQDEDGETYLPGEDVPASVTTLTAQWVDGVVVGDFVVKGGISGTDYGFGGGVLTVKTSTPLTISMKPGVEKTSNRITVGGGVCADITLAGVNIETNASMVRPLNFKNAGSSVLTLASNTKSVLKANVQASGIYIEIPNGKLTINGDGKLETHGSVYWPGIGGYYSDKVSLEINGGFIDAFGGANAAGIGGSSTTSGGTIVINDGVINAYGGAATGEYHSGAGIGGGAEAKPDNITINGGTIYAVGGSTDIAGKSGGAGIGGGGNSGMIGNIGGNITINGGTVTAQGGTGPFGAGAGIGAGGRSASIGSIAITGGVINATAGANGAAGIGGGGHSGRLNSLRITGGFMMATGTYKGNNPGDGNANAIGGGASEAPADLTGVTGAVIIDGTAKTGTVYGNATLNQKAKIPAGVTLTIPEDASLTLGAPGRLDIDGVVKVDGTLANYGYIMLNDIGDIQYAVKWNLTNVTYDKGEEIIYVSTKGGYTATLSAVKGYALPASVTVTVDGTPLSGDYTYDKSTGALSINFYIASRMEITAEGRLLSADAGVTAVSVSGTAGRIDGTTIKVALPYGTPIPTDPGALSFTLAAGAEVTALTTNNRGRTWTFTVTAENGETTQDYTISVIVSRPPAEDDYYTITATAGAGGSISPNGSVPVWEGLDKTFTITPEDGYVIGDVLLDGESVKSQLSGGSYTLENVRKAHTIEVIFREKTKSNPFTDVKEADWFYADVMAACENGWFAGTSASTFDPSAGMTRGMIVTALYRMEGKPSIEDEIRGYPFADVDAEAYYGAAVYWARLNHIVDGYDAEHFGPNDAITREQLAAILYRYAQYKGYETDAAMGMAGFVDADRVSTYAVSAVQWACASGLLQGSGGKLTPRGSALRCEVAAILNRFYQGFVK